MKDGQIKELKGEKPKNQRVVKPDQDNLKFLEYPFWH